MVKVDRLLTRPLQVEVIRALLNKESGGKQFSLKVDMRYGWDFEVRRSEGGAPHVTFSVSPFSTRFRLAISEAARALHDIERSTARSIRGPKHKEGE